MEAGNLRISVQWGSFYGRLPEKRSFETRNTGGITVGNVPESSEEKEAEKEGKILEGSRRSGNQLLC